MINTRRLSAGIVVSVMVLVLSAGCAGTQSRQSTGEFVDDSVVTTKVKTALIQDERVDALDIQVKTFKGVVQLSGFADTHGERKRANRITRRIAGVKRVQNDIRLKN